MSHAWRTRMLASLLTTPAFLSGCGTHDDSDGQDTGRNGSPAARGGSSTGGASSSGGASSGGASSGAVPATPQGPAVTCVPPGAKDAALLNEGLDPAAVEDAELDYYAGGALFHLDGVECTLQPHEEGNGICQDVYLCADCTIRIQYFGGDDTSGAPSSRSLTGSCPAYSGAYSLCELSTSCDGMGCGQDSCGRTCGEVCSAGSYCQNGACVDTCTPCLEACSGLPACCTGAGCQCESACF